MHSVHGVLQTQVENVTVKLSLYAAGTQLPLKSKEKLGLMDTQTLTSLLILSWFHKQALYFYAFDVILHQKNSNVYQTHFISRKAVFYTEQTCFILSSVGQISFKLNLKITVYLLVNRDEITGGRLISHQQVMR